MVRSYRERVREVRAHVRPRTHSRRGRRLNNA